MTNIRNALREWKPARARRVPVVRAVAATVGLVALLIGPSACGSGGSTSASQATAPAVTKEAGASSAEPTPEQLIFQDNFDGPAGSAPDPTKWTPKIGTPNGDKELQYYTDNKNAVLDGEGDLVITAKKQATPGSSCRGSECQYTSARLSTKNASGGYLFSQQGGRFEARIKLPQGVGAWSAFWLLGANKRPWPAQGEIDIAEAPGGDSYNPVQSFLHGPYAPPGSKNVSGKGAPQSARAVLPGTDFYSGFHTYTVDQTATTVTFYIDGEKWWQANSDQFTQDTWVYNQPWYMILNLAVGDYGGTPPPGDFTKQMIVDWVRVYKLA